MWVEVTSLWVWNSFVVRRLWVPVFGVVGGFCGCVMGVMGLWFVFGGGGGYCFRLSPGRVVVLMDAVFGRVCWGVAGWW